MAKVIKVQKNCRPERTGKVREEFRNNKKERKEI